MGLVSLACARKARNKIAILLNKNVGNTWTLTELLETPEETFPGIIAYGSGGEKGNRVLTFWSANTDGAPSIMQYAENGNMYFCMPKVDDEVAVTFGLETPNYGKRIVCGVYDWTTGVSTYYSHRPGESGWNCFLSLAEPCGSMRAAACAPVVAFQTASRLMVTTLTIKRGRLTGTRLREVGDSLFLTFEGYSPVGNATYQWYHNGNILPGQSEQRLHLSYVDESSTGWYVCRVQDESNSVFETEPAYVRVLPAGSLPAISTHRLTILFGLLIIFAWKYYRGLVK